MYIVIILLIICALQLLYIKKWKYGSLEKIPSPKGLPILGHMTQMSGNIDDMFEKIIAINKMFGQIVVMWKTPITPKIMITHPEVANKILSSFNHLDRSHFYEFMVPFLGRGLVTSIVDVWKKDRKLLNLAFNLKLMESYNKIFEYHGDELVTLLRKEVGKKSVNLVPFVDLYALDVVCEGVVNVRTHLQRKVDMEYLDARSTFLTIVMNREYSFYKGIDFFFQFTDEYKIQQNCAKVLRKFSQHLIEERTKNEGKHSTDVDDTFKTVTDVLSEGNVPMDKAVDQVNTFVVAGHDTPASTIAFAFYIIAHNPELQDRLLKESISILGCDKTTVITIQDLQRMVYLEAVIKEVLRLYPAVPLIERKTEMDIHVDGITIPAGVDVTINIYGLQRNQDFCEDPETFNPDRFLPENVSKMKTSALMAFSKGPRDCIGKTFAMYQMKSAIAKVIRNFELLPADPAQKLVLTSEFVLKSSTGIQVQLCHRNL